jgi:hypothetical protein
MALRNDWKFPYVLSTVLEGARKRLAHHQGRLDWWERKKEEVIARIKREGLEIDESLAAGFGSAKTYSRDTSVLIRNDLQQDLNETTGKVREHRAKRDEYQHWVVVLEGQRAMGQFDLQLDFQDYLYFLAEYQAPGA